MEQATLNDYFARLEVHRDTARHLVWFEQDANGCGPMLREEALDLTSVVVECSLWRLGIASSKRNDALKIWHSPGNIGEQKPLRP